MSGPRMALGAKGRAAVLVAAGAVIGGVLAVTLSANAADSGSSATATTPSYAAPPFAGGPGRPGGGPGGSSPVRSDESTPSSDIVSTLTKKAEARVSGGTVIRVETDAGDAAYEAHMQAKDGSLVTVKFDKSLDITSVEQGMGRGDPRPTQPG